MLLNNMNSRYSLLGLFGHLSVVWSYYFSAELNLLMAVFSVDHGN